MTSFGFWSSNSVCFENFLAGKLLCSALEENLIDEGLKRMRVWEMFRIDEDDAVLTLCIDSFYG